MKKIISLFFLFSQIHLFAATIDLGGAMRVDTARINDYRRADGPTTSADSHIINGSDDAAIISSYVFRLNPEMIVNDHVSVKAEISTDNGRGGSSGDSHKSASNFGSQFYQTVSNGTNELNFNKFFMEIYSDIATYRVGRFEKHWGLGAVYHGGEDVNDRFFSSFDGIEGRFSFGKIYLTPYFAYLAGGQNFTHSHQSTEFGMSALYDNPDKDQQLGVLWSHRKAGSQNGVFANGTTDFDISLTLIDIFYKKYWDRLSLAIEVPYIDGDVKTAPFSSFKPQAYLAELGFEINDAFSVGLKGGYVSGDSTPSNAKLEQMYLNPNYKVSRLMFRYNLNTVEDTAGNDSGNIFDSHITNASYARLGATLHRKLWSWNFAVLWAQANKTLAGQESDLGLEADVEFIYKWNPKLDISGFVAYHKVGKYFEYSTAGTIKTKDPIGAGVAVNLKF